MSNKVDFYNFLQECGERGPTDVEFRRFQHAHPGVLWRKVGKSNYQISFRRNEGWLDLESFSGNLISSMSHNLIGQFNKCGKVMSEGKLLKLLNIGKLSPKALASVGLFTEDVVREQVEARLQTELSKVNIKLVEAELEEAKKDRLDFKMKWVDARDGLEQAIKANNSWLELVRKAIKFLKDKKGITGLSRAETEELISLLSKSLP